MEYKVCTKSETEIYNREYLLDIHKEDKTLCRLLRAGTEQINYEIIKNDKVIHTIIFVKQPHKLCGCSENELCWECTDIPLI